MAAYFWCSEAAKKEEKGNIQSQEQNNHGAHGILRETPDFYFVLMFEF